MPNVSIKDGTGTLIPITTKLQSDNSQLPGSEIYIAPPSGTGDAVPVSATNPLSVIEQSQPITGQTLSNGTGIIGWLSNLFLTFNTKSIRTNAGFAAPGQTIKNYTGTITSSASVATTVTLETVTTGKTYVITDIYISSNTATQFEARVQANGVDVFRGWCKGDTAPISLAGIESQPNASSGQAVTLLLPAIAGAPIVSFFFGGLEQ